MAKITIIFIGLIAHVFPIDNHQVALLIQDRQHQHGDHHQLLIGDPDEVRDIDGITPFPPAKVDTKILPPGDRRVLNIQRAWLKPKGESGPVDGPSANENFDMYMPSLRDLSGDKPLRTEITENKVSVPDIAARFYTLSGRRSVESALPTMAKFANSSEPECVAECVKVEIEAEDVDGYVWLLSENKTTGRKRGVRVKTGATIIIANVPRVCPENEVPSHFRMFGRLVEPMMDLEDPEPGGKCRKLPTKACPNPFPCSRVVDIECSASRYP